MELDTTVDVDLDKVEEFIQSDKFVNYLLTNVSGFGECAFILQNLMEAVKTARDQLTKGED